MGLAIGKPIQVKENQKGMNGSFDWIFFRMEDGTSARTTVSRANSNYIRWAPIIQKVKAGEEVWLKNLVLMGKGLINADSWFEVIKKT